MFSKYRKKGKTTMHTRKRVTLFSLLVVLLLLITMPYYALAKTYSFDDYGLAIVVPDDAVVITKDNVEEYSITDADAFRASGSTLQVNGGQGNNRFVLGFTADYGTKNEKMSFENKKNDEILGMTQDSLLHLGNTVPLDLFDIYDSGRYKFIHTTQNIEQASGYPLDMMILGTIQGKTSVAVTATYMSGNAEARAGALKIIDSITIREKTIWDKAASWIQKAWKDHPVLVVIFGGPVVLSILYYVIVFIFVLLSQLFKRRKSDLTP